MLKYYGEYNEAKKYVKNVFDVLAYEEDDYQDEDEYFCCPECAEPLYAVDYDYPTSWSENGGKPWSYCPVCGYDWYNDNYGDYEDDDYDDEV